LVSKLNAGKLRYGYEHILLNVLKRVFLTSGGYASTALVSSGSAYSRLNSLASSTASAITNLVSYLASFANSRGYNGSKINGSASTAYNSAASVYAKLNGFASSTAAALNKVQAMINNAYNNATRTFSSVVNKPIIQIVRSGYTDIVTYLVINTNSLYTGNANSTYLNYVVPTTLNFSVVANDTTNYTLNV
jgi:hypothetical protein